MVPYPRSTCRLRWREGELDGPKGGFVLYTCGQFKQISRCFFFFFSEMPDLAMRHMPFRSIGMSGRSQICPSRDRSKDAWLQYLGSGGRCGRTSGSGTTCSSDSHVTCVPVSSKAALLKAIDMICSHLIDMIYRTGTSDNTKQKQTGPYLGWSNKEVSQDL